MQGTTTRQDGFTLIEALVALAIVALAVTTCLMFRTGSLVDANEARNWRVAREVAQEILSELRAGAREEPPQNDDMRKPIPGMEEVRDWEYQIVIGEAAISELEGSLEAAADDASDSGENADLRDWQRERDDLRRARQKGMSFYEYREQSKLEEQDRLEREELPPTEDEFEEVAVVVYFPNARQVTGHGGRQSHFVLKARISTLAIEGLTPEEAETLNGGNASEGGGSAAAEGGTSK